FHLRRGEARRAVAALALEDLRIEVAARRIVDEAVLEAVKGVACTNNRLMDHRILAGWDEARLILQHGLGHPDAPGVKVGLGICGSARDDAVEIVWEPLRFHNRLTSARRTSIPIRTF